MGKALIGKEWRVGIQEEAAFKTPIADNAAFKEIVCDFMPIKSDLKYRNNDNVNTGARFQDASGVDVDSVGSMPSCTIKGTAIKDDLDFFLYALFQYVVEGANTPYVKTFSFPPTANIPDFANNEGMSLTILSRAPEASISQKFSGAICKKLELSISPTANDGLLQFSADMVGLGAVVANSNPSGTMTKAARSTFGFHNINAFTINSNELVLKSWKSVLENLAIGMSPAGDGTWGWFALTDFKATIEFTAMNDANARTTIASAMAGTVMPHNLNWGTDGVDGNLNIFGYGKMEEPERIASDTADVNFKMNMMSDTTNSHADPIIIKLANAIDRTW